MLSRLMFVLVAALLIAGSGGRAVRAQDGPPDFTFAEKPNYPELTISLTSDGWQIPAEVKAGRVLITFKNETDLEFADAQLMEIPDGVSVDEIRAVFASPDQAGAPAWLYNAHFPGGAPALGGAIGQAIVDLTPGDYVLLSTDPSISTDAGVSTFTVTGGEDPTTATEPVSDATFTLIDFAIEVPDHVPAGPQAWKVTHEGDHPHFISIMQSPGPITRDQFGQLSESEESGATPAADLPNPEEFTPIGYSPVISTGVTEWLPMNLEPGYYTVACYVPDQTGQPHSMLGMYNVFEAK